MCSGTDAVRHRCGQAQMRSALGDALTLSRTCMLNLSLWIPGFIKTVFHLSPKCRKFMSEEILIAFGQPQGKH
jgi:hypothetical protein